MQVLYDSCLTNFRIRSRLRTKLKVKQVDVIPKKLRFEYKGYHDHLKKLSNSSFSDHFSWQLKRIMLSRHAEPLNGQKDWPCPTVRWYKISSLEPRIVLAELFFFNLNDDPRPKLNKKYLTWRGRQNAKNAEVEYHYHLLRQKPLIPLNFFE